MKALLDRRKRVLEYVDQLLEERPNDEVFSRTLSALGTRRPQMHRGMLPMHQTRPY